MHFGKPQQFQVFIRSPDLKIPNRALTLSDPNQTWGDLMVALQAEADLFFLSINGKTLDDSSTVLSSGIAPFSTLTLQLKLLGGGGDGGATGAESRDCYLNMYAEKKPDKVDPNEKRLSKWTTCALSFEPLSPPCVIDPLGNVFNKEVLVKALLGKTLPRAFSHIKGLKDMITVHMSEFDRGDLKFQCPITGLEFNGKYRFVALRKCGHVLSAKALKEVKSSACLVCHEEFEEADKIVINGTDDEVAVLRNRMLQEKANKVKEKKSKKVKNGEDSVVSGKKHGIGVNNVPAKRFKAVDNAPPNANKKVYASIFTSSGKSDFRETFACRSLPLGRN